MATFSDDQVFGTPAPAQAGMSDNEVFGNQGPKTYSDAEVFAPSVGQQILQAPGELSKRVVTGARDTIADQFLKGPAEALPFDAATLRKEHIRKLMAPPELGGQGLKFGDAFQQAMAANIAADPNRADPRQTGLYKAGEALSNVGKDVLAPKPGWEESVLGDIASGFGSVGASIAPGLLGPIGVAASAATMPFGGSAEAAERARKAGATPEQTLNAAQGLGAVAGATDLVDLSLMKAGYVGKVASATKKALLRLIEGGVVEGTQEGIQQFLQNLGARGYNKDQSLSEGVLYNAAIGSVVGAGAKAGLGAAQDPRATAVPGTPGAPSAVPPGPGVPGDQLAATIAGLGGSDRSATALGLDVPAAAVAPVRPEMFPPANVQGPEIGKMDPRVVEYLAGNLKSEPVTKTAEDPLAALAAAKEDVTLGQPGANISRLSALLGSSLYGKPEDIADVSIKEMVQNSFDALKPLVSGGQIEKGQIHIQADPASRTITLTDNGIGMNPDVMGGAFLRLAETHKEGAQASGGFGIAKMLYLFGNKRLVVTSMRNGKVHRMTTSGSELQNSADNPSNDALKPRITTSQPTAQDYRTFPQGHGTAVSVVVPESYDDPSSGETKIIPFHSWRFQDSPVLQKSPLFHNIEVHYNGQQLGIGTNFPYHDYTQFSNVNFGWGTAKIYVSKKVIEKSSYEDNLHILSNGLWQFDSQLKKNPNSTFGPNVQRDVYIDVQPKVKPEEPGYPFALNRQGFAKSVEKDFGKILNYMSILYNQQDLQEQVKNFGDMQYMGSDKDGVFASPKIKIEPSVPAQETPLTMIREGDEVSVENGQLVVNGRKIPELTPKDLERLKGVDVSSLVVPQDQIDSQGIMLHDNVDVKISELEQRSLVDLARERFGQKFDEFVFSMGSLFRDLRDAVSLTPEISGLPSFRDIRTEPVGISFDIEYRGISIVVPFRAAFLNIAVPEDPKSPVSAALGMYYTMLHELAHHRHRSEEHLAPVLQRLAVALDASTTFNSQEFKQKLVNVLGTHEDVFRYLNGVMLSGTFPISPRGKRLETNGQQQRRDAPGAPDYGAAVPGRPAAGTGDQGVGNGPAASGRQPESSGVPLKISGDRRRHDTGLGRNQRALDADGRGVPATERPPEIDFIGKNIEALFSRTSGTSPASGTPAAVQTFAAHASRMNRWFKYMAGLDQLNKANPNFPPLNRYAETVEQMHQEESAIHDAAVRVAKKWRGLGKKGEGLVQLLDDMAHMRYRTPAEVTAGTSRMPTRAELDTLVRKYSIDDETLKVFNDIRKMFDAFLSVVESNAVSTASRIVRDPARLQAKVAEIRAQIAEMRTKPYFPFIRFGRHFVLKKDASGRTVDFQTYERRGLVSAERVQQRAYQEAVRTKAIDEQVTFGILDENVAPFVGMPPAMLDMIKTQLNLTPDQLTALEQIQLQRSPALSFGRLMKSNYIPGYSMDFKRAFARYFFHGGKYHARTKYANVLNGLVEQAGSVQNDNKAHLIRDYMRDHLQNTVLDAKGDHGVFKGAIFTWGLGYSVYGAAQNLAQMPMVIFPTLAAKFGGIGIGDRRASFELMKAMTDVTSFYKRGTYTGMNDFEMKALDYGIKRGIISETQAPQLAGLSVQGNLYQGFAGNALERGSVQFQEKAAWMFEMSEQFLRRATYRAALRLAMKYPNTKAVQEAVVRRSSEYADLQGRFSQQQAAAMVTAADMTSQANFVYARYARPRFMRGKLSGTLLVFQKYMQSLTMLLGQNKSDILPRYLLMAALLGGQGAIPGYDEFRDILKFIAKHLFGKDFNLDLKTREWVTQLTNGTVPPDIVLHGLARGGFGIPALLDLMGSKPSRGLGVGPGQNTAVPQFDMSRMVSMSHFLPFELGKLLDPGKNQDKALAEQTQRASGAVFSVGFNLYKALQGDSGAVNGPNDPKWWAEWKRWEKTIPRALKDTSHAMRAFVEGRERGKGGPESAPTIVPFDPRDTEQMSEIIGLGLGFTPRRLQEKWDSIMAKVEVQGYFDVKREALLQQMFEATSGKDPKEIESVTKDIRKFNSELPDFARGKGISFDTVQNSIRTRALQKNARESGVPFQKSNIGISQHIDALFPGTVIDVRKPR